jgi:hypothetical protein
MANSFFPDNVFELVESSLSEGLTQSEIMLRQNCARKWYFRYAQMLKHKGSISWSLLWGDVMHQVLDRYYTFIRENPDIRQQEICYQELTHVNFRFSDDILLSPDDRNELYYYHTLTEIMLPYYVKHWWEKDHQITIHNVEKLIEYNYRGFILKGKIDLIFKENPKHGLATDPKGYWLTDHKTTYTLYDPLIAGWRFRFQFLFYAWMSWKLTGIYPNGLIVNAIRKPALRRSVAKAESMDDYLNRIALDIAERPEDYFKRERLPFDHETLPRFEKTGLIPILNQFEQLHGAVLSLKDGDIDINDPDWQDTLMALLINMNPDYCWSYGKACEFLPLCSNNFYDFNEEYVHSNLKHEELHK